MALDRDEWNYTLSASTSPWFTVVGNPSAFFGFLNVTHETQVRRQPLPLKPWTARFRVFGIGGLAVETIFTFPGLVGMAPALRWDGVKFNAVDGQYGLAPGTFGSGSRFFQGQELTGGFVDMRLVVDPVNRTYQAIAMGEVSGQADSGVVTLSGAPDLRSPMIVGNNTDLGDSNDFLAVLVGDINYRPIVYYADLENTTEPGNGTRNKPLDRFQLEQFLKGSTVPLYDEGGVRFSTITSGDVIRLFGTLEGEDEDVHVFENIQAAVTLQGLEDGTLWKVRANGFSPVRRVLFGNTNFPVTIRDGVFGPAKIANQSAMEFKNCVFTASVDIDTSVRLRFDGCTFRNAESDQQSIVAVADFEGGDRTNEVDFNDCAFFSYLIRDAGEGITNGIIRIAYNAFSLPEEFGEEFTVFLQHTDDVDFDTAHNYFETLSTPGGDYPLFQDVGFASVDVSLFADPATLSLRKAAWIEAGIQYGLYGYARTGPGAFRFPGGLVITYVRLQADSGLPNAALLGRDCDFKFVGPAVPKALGGDPRKSVIEAGEVFRAADFTLHENPVADISKAAQTLVGTRPVSYPAFVRLEEDSENRPALYFGLQGEDLRGTFQSVFFSLDADPFFLPKGDGQARRVFQNIEWQYFSDKDMTASRWDTFTVADRTIGFSRSESVEFILPRDAVKKNLFGSELYWVRALLLEPGLSNLLPVKVRGFYQNGVMAENLATVRDEVLGTSKGTAGQTFGFRHAPVAAGQQIWVKEPDLPDAAEIEVLIEEAGPEPVLDVTGTEGIRLYVLVRWTEVPDFSRSLADSRHYMMDREKGVAVFGDGVRGRIPDPAHDGIVARFYRWGGGSAGNVKVGDVLEMRNSIPAVVGVRNVEAGGGGGDAGSATRLAKEGARSLRNGDVSSVNEDYEGLALEAGANVVRAVALYTTGPDLLFRRGSVTVALLTQDPGSRPKPAPHVIDRVRSFLEERAQATARERIESDPSVPAAARHIEAPDISVIAPNYVRVGVSADVHFLDAQPREAIAAVEKALTAFLHPLTGRPEGTGWEFGASVRAGELHPVIRSVPGVATVGEIRLVANQLRLALPVGTGGPMAGMGEHFFLPEGLQVRLIETVTDAPSRKYSFVLAERKFNADPALVLEGFKQGDLLELIAEAQTFKEAGAGCETLPDAVIGRGRIGAVRVLARPDGSLPPVQDADGNLVPQLAAAQAEIDVELCTLDTVLLVDGKPREFHVDSDAVIRARVTRQRKPREADTSPPPEDVLEQDYLRIEIPVSELVNAKGDRFVAKSRDDLAVGKDVAPGKKHFMELNTEELATLKLHLPVAGATAATVLTTHLTPVIIDDSPFGPSQEPPIPDVPFPADAQRPLKEKTDRVYLGANDLPYAGTHDIAAKGAR